MREEATLTTRVISGAAAGIAATIGLQGVRAVSHEKLPYAKPPIREEPGKFMVERAKSLLAPATRDVIPKRVESVAERLLALGYGMSFGALYALLRPRDGSLLLEGTALGAGTWVVGYLGWLPATGLMPPVTKQKPQQVGVPLAEHVLFGIAAVGGYRLLRRVLTPPD
jgi:hypothetical protein